MDTKKEVRQYVKSLRDALPCQERTKKSAEICKKITDHPWFQSADEILCYMHCQSEVETHNIILTAISHGKRVAIPKIEGNDMFFYYLENLSDVEKGYHSILEPKGRIPAKNKNALIIMPGVAFDQNRNRIGYGKGFYDRYCEKYRQIKKIAIAYNCQVLKSIPSDMHDVKPELLVTEEKIYD